MPVLKPSFPRLRRGDPLNDRLVGAWSMFEGSGLRVNDISGRGHDGILTSDNAWIGGRAGHAVQGNSSIGVRVDTGCYDLAGVLDVSLSLWFSTTSTAGGLGTNAVISWGAQYNLAMQGIDLDIENGEIYQRSFGGNILHSGASGVYNDGEWHHLVLLLPAGCTTAQETLYVDGKRLSPTTGGSATANWGTDAPVTLLYDAVYSASPKYADVTIDDVRVWANRLLTRADVERLFAARYGEFRPRPWIFSGAAGGGATTGDGVWALGAPGLAGTGVEQPSGAGALPLDAAGLAGAGIETFDGAGEWHSDAAGLAGDAVMQPSGAGMLPLGAPRLAGVGIETLTALAVLPLAAAELVGEGSSLSGIAANGAWSHASPGWAATALMPPDAAGAFLIEPAVLAGIAELAERAAGALPLAAPSLAGAGAESDPAVGIWTASAPGLAGTGTERDTGMAAWPIAAAVLAALASGGEVAVEIVMALASLSVLPTLSAAPSMTPAIDGDASTGPALGGDVDIEPGAGG